MRQACFQNQEFETVFGLFELAAKKKLEFDLSHQLKKKKLVSKQLVYYISNANSLFHRGVYLSKKNMGQNSSFLSKSICHNPLGTNTQAGDQDSRAEF